MNLYRAKVTRVTPAGVFVEIKSTWPGVEWGPLKRVANATTTEPDHSHGTPSAGEHDHVASVITSGQTVLVAEVNRDDLVVIGALI